MKLLERYMQWSTEQCLAGNADKVTARIAGGLACGGVVMVGLGVGAVLEGVPILGVPAVAVGSVLAAGYGHVNREARATPASVHQTLLETQPPTVN